MTTPVRPPVCPNCGGREWRYFEAGRYKDEHTVEFGGDRMKITKDATDTDVDNSFFYCAACALGDDSVRTELNEVQQGLWDATWDYLDTLRDSADWTAP